MCRGGMTRHLTTSPSLRRIPPPLLFVLSPSHRRFFLFLLIGPRHHSILGGRPGISGLWFSSSYPSSLSHQQPQQPVRCTHTHTHLILLRESCIQSGLISCIVERGEVGKDARKTSRAETDGVTAVMMQLFREPGWFFL